MISFQFSLQYKNKNYLNLVPLDLTYDFWHVLVIFKDQTLKTNYSLISLIDVYLWSDLMMK